MARAKEGNSALGGAGANREERVEEREEDRAAAVCDFLFDHLPEVAPAARVVLRTRFEAFREEQEEEPLRIATRVQELRESVASEGGGMVGGALASDASETSDAFGVLPFMTMEEIAEDFAIAEGPADDRA